MINFLLTHKIFALVFLIVFFIPVIFFLISSSAPHPDGSDLNPTPGRNVTIIPEAVNVSPLQKSKIGETTDAEAGKLPGFLKKEQIQGGTRYSFESELNLRPNEIITKNGVVVFERELTPPNPNTPGFATISETVSRFGEPESIVQGSKFYGWMMKHYIYASAGFAFLANENTNEIFEFYFFEPTTVDRYILLYGEDITYATGPQKE